MLGRWARPHVCKEVLEQLPSLTDFDPSASIVLVVGLLRIAGSIFHVHPDRILCDLACASCPVLFPSTTWHGVDAGDSIWPHPVASNAFSWLIVVLLSSNTPRPEELTSALTPRGLRTLIFNWTSCRRRVNRPVGASSGMFVQSTLWMDGST